MSEIIEDYWGIDVSKSWLDIAIKEQVFRIAQTEKAIKEFIKVHKKNTQKIVVVLESTGGYEQLAARYLSESAFIVHIAHPNKVKAFIRAKGKLAKTDKIDAKLLKEYGRFINLDEIKTLPSLAQRELQLLGSRLAQLKEMHHQESCRLGIANKVLVKKSIMQILKIFKKEIRSIEEQIMTRIHADSILSNRLKVLRSMKGVGPVLAMTLIVSLPELGEANKKEIAALVGVAPITNQSGQKIGKAMTKYGRPGVRKILYMGALTACRYNTKLKIFYEKLVAAGKPKKVAIVAVMRKMLVILTAMVQSKSYYCA